MDPKIISVPAKTSKIPLESAGKLLFDRITNFHKNSIAFVDAKTGTPHTYGNLATTSLNLASNLRGSLGIAKNDHLAIVSENSHNVWVAALAGLYLAAPFHLLNPGFTTYELKKYLEMSKPKVVFCSKQVAPKILTVKEDCGFIVEVIVFDDVVYGDLIKEGQSFEIEKVDDLEDQVAYIANSSGTTGLPKGVMVTHANLRLNMSHVVDFDLYPFKDDSVILHVIPFYHVHGCGICYCGLYRGLKIIIMDQFEPKSYLHNIQEYKVTTLFIVPTLADFLANSPLPNDYDLSTVEEIYSAAAILSTATHQEVLKKFNLKSVRQIYGATEIGTAVFMTVPASSDLGSVGRVTPGHSVKIVDANTDEPLPVLQPGEIRVKAATMRGYLGDPENTRSAFDASGFVRTGDVGYYDEDNNFYIVDRIKDLIKYKGFQVPPQEIEEILMRHPGVRDVAVVGRPDERCGEVAVAFVVPVEGAEVGERELVDFVAEFVSGEKRLHGGVRFVGGIARNGVGKVLRRELRKML